MPDLKYPSRDAPVLKTCLIIVGLDISRSFLASALTTSQLELDRAEPSSGIEYIIQKYVYSIGHVGVNVE